MTWETIKPLLNWQTLYRSHAIINNFKKLTHSNSQFTTNKNSNIETFQRLDDCRVRLDWDTVALWLTLTARHFSLTSPVPGQRLTQRSLHSVHSRLSWTAANRSMTLVCNLGAKGRLPRSMFHLESVHSDFPPLVVFLVSLTPSSPAPGSLSDASLIVPDAGNPVASRGKCIREGRMWRPPLYCQVWTRGII